MPSVKEFHPGDVVRMRKPHPCGGQEWTITRVGADVRLRCLKCGRRVMLSRSHFEKRIKETISSAVLNSAAEEQ
jgi:hypothetical protein